MDKQIHQMTMRTSEIDMAKSVEPADIDTFINNSAWFICKTYHNTQHTSKILQGLTSPGAAETLNDQRFLLNKTGQYYSDLFACRVLYKK